MIQCNCIFFSLLHFVHRQPVDRLRDKLIEIKNVEIKNSIHWSASLEEAEAKNEFTEMFVHGKLHFLNGMYYMLDRPEEYNRNAKAWKEMLKDMRTEFQKIGKLYSSLLRTFPRDKTKENEVKTKTNLLLDKMKSDEFKRLEHYTTMDEMGEIVTMRKSLSPIVEPGSNE